MDNKRFLTLLIGVMIGGLILASFVPIFTDLKTSMGTAQMNTTENYNAVYTDDLATDVKIELGTNNELIANGETIDLALDLTEQVLITNEFIVNYTGSELIYNGLSGTSIKEITVHPDGTFSYTTTADVEKTGSGVNVVIYPDKEGDYGAFYEGVGNESFYLDNGKSVYCAFLSGGITDSDSDSHYVNCMWSATNENIAGTWNTVYSREVVGGVWADLSCSLGAPNSISKQNVGELSTEWSINYLTATFTNDSGDFTSTVGSPTIFAPLEYHVLTENNSVTYMIVSLIPLIAGVGLLMFAVAYFLNRY